ncbi:MAG: AMP-binding protein [Chloroflexi bacterium]|jgi:long-chain acyl-CoA synthetase|nr:AMP-binding protein [Chloroflexota bacterium]MBT7080672.1 AMP-binding protein [Chloroflexota bacterium]MBT7290249.1 AMP-binding protein [Chloroflexota bacterium]
MNVARLAQENIDKFGEYVSIIYEDKEYTNTRIECDGRKLGNALLQMGVVRADRIIIQMPNCPEVLSAFQAIFKIGAVIVPINYLVGHDELTHIYRDSGTTTVITSIEFLDKVKAAKAEAPNVKNVILVDGSAPDMFSYTDLIADSSDELDMVDTEDDELAALIYTAGTTGKPKGVMLTHKALYSNAYNQYNTVNPGPETVNITALPLSHSYGVALMNGTLLNGNKTVLLRWFNLQQYFEAMEKYKTVATTAVPTMYIYMLLYPDAHKYDISSMKFWVYGSAPMSNDHIKQMQTKFGAWMVEGWGLTEAGGNNSFNTLAGFNKMGSIGTPMSGVEMKIFDEDSKELPQGQAGEIVIRGDMLMQGYWNMPEQTAEVLRDGWLYTGDIGYVDEEGYFYITDRKKDMLIKGGENIFPREVENVLMDHSCVMEAAVIGIPDDTYGENVKAFITLAPEQKVSDVELIAHCKEKLGSFKSPKVVKFMDALPKSVMGKILKKELRKLD